MKRKIKIIIKITALGIVGGTIFWGLPRLRSRLISHNESAAIAFMKNLSSSQAQIQASGEKDVDGDGAGEYGFFGELNGSIPFLGSDKSISIPVLGRNHLMPIGGGIYIKSGYFFRMYLPGTKTPGVVEPSHPTAAHGTLVDPTQSCRIWWCVAWPAWHGITGNRMFIVTQAGDILSSANHVRRYSGRENMPATGFSSPPDEDKTKPWVPTVNAHSRDGSRWHVV